MNGLQDKVAFINLRETSPAMDESAFMGDLEENGRRIFAVFKDLVSTGKFELEPTGKGFHLCVPKQGRKVRIMQIWAAPRDWLESRMQYIKKDIVLTEGLKHSIQSALIDARFHETSGDEGNMSYKFGKQSTKDLTEGELKTLRTSLLKVGKLIRDAEENT